MPENEPLFYLDNEDRAEFSEYWGTENQDLLTAGSRTMNRLERYLPNDDFQVLRVIFTALHRDFQLPNVRYTVYVAMAVFFAQIEQGKKVSSDSKDILETELAIGVQHLMQDENEKYERDLELVITRWNDYISNPSAFVL
ncbi:hypothetical protein [Alteromonas antoniana]|uniref:hypothetical protein n=1 Tax=Alteromonas antoniana TaxID=2803813 RepID=UPI001C45ED94|nr:hypothetical protein [Alteromonas antoniana]